MEKQEFCRLFGEFIAQKRRDKGWRQQDLADKINGDYQNVSRLERGVVNPSFHSVNELALAFNTNLAQMMIEFQTFISNSSPEKRKLSEVDIQAEIKKRKDKLKEIQDQLSELEKPKRVRIKKS